MPGLGIVGEKGNGSCEMMEKGLYIVLVKKKEK